MTPLLARSPLPFHIAMSTILLGIACSAEAATFEWPLVGDRNAGQPYSCKGIDQRCVSHSKYHTGIDMTSTTTDRQVRAVSSGVVTVIDQGSFKGWKYINCNHKMGKIVIIDHHNRTYSLYAHLERIDVSDTQYVLRGDPIGIYGNTGSEAACNNDDFSAHLHFELKNWPVIGAVADDQNEIYWGYTPEFPNLHGYINPNPYFDLEINYMEPTVIEVIAENSAILTGPDPAEYEQILGMATRGQLFVALSEYNGWYQIYFPRGSGAATGWIQGSVANTETTLEVNDPGDLRHAGVHVRTVPSTATASITRVWDGQFHVQTAKAPSGSGCAESWHQLHIPGAGSAEAGWVCGEYLLENRCLNLHSTVDPIPEGYGAPYNVLSDVRELMLRASCGEADATIIVGTGMRNQHVYRLGHEWTGTAWRQFELSGKLAEGSTDWFVGKASATRLRSASELSQDNFIIAHVCTRTGAEWKCGCRDTACSQALWQLQNFRRP